MMQILDAVLEADPLISAERMFMKAEWKEHINLEDLAVPGWQALIHKEL